MASRCNKLCFCQQRWNELSVCNVLVAGALFAGELLFDFDPMVCVCVCISCVSLLVGVVGLLFVEGR